MVISLPLALFCASLSRMAVTTKGFKVACKYNSSSGAVTEGLRDKPSATRCSASPATQLVNEMVFVIESKQKEKDYPSCG